VKELDPQSKARLLTAIRDVPDFPKPGIVFKDITTLLNDAEAFGLLMDHLAERYRDAKLSYIAGIESRGFIFGAALAAKLGVGFVPIRKKGKLPAATIAEKYALEYGFDEVEIHIDAFRGQKGANVLLIDDLIATGGTAEAAIKLIQDAGGTCVEACFIIDLAFLKGREKITPLAPVYAVLEID